MPFLCHYFSLTNLLSNTFFTELPLNLQVVNSYSSNQGTLLNKTPTLSNALKVFTLFSLSSYSQNAKVPKED